MSKCASAIAIVFICALVRFAWPQTAGAIRDIQIGAYDADAWNGIVFLAESGGTRISFGVRIGSRVGSFLDGNDIYKAVTEVGPHAPDGSYCRMSWRHPPRETPVTLEWSRAAADVAVGRITAPGHVQLVLEGYLPKMGMGEEGVFAVRESDGLLLGERYFDRVFGASARFVVMTDRPVAGGGAYASLDALRNSMRASGRLSQTDEPLAQAAGLEFRTGDSRTAHFVAILGNDERNLDTRARALLAPGKIDDLLAQRSAEYAKAQPRVDGLFAGAPEAIGNTMFWNTLYAPSNRLVFPSISRAWAHNFGGWVIGEWDCFFGALLTSVEDRTQTLVAIKAILSAQTDTGVVPNIASGSGASPDRSQPPVGSYVTWKIYQKFPDREFLAWAYPRLKKWHEWWLSDRGDGQPWRDGNRDGLLEWGSDRGSSSTIGGRGSIRQAKWESGMDDSPMYDSAAYDPRTYTLNLEDVGLNSLYALDAECLARLATILDQQDDSRRFAAEYDRMRRLIQDKLWNERDGIYENRFWDGRFSPSLSPTNFYPMVAGIATPEQSRRMVREHLLNPKEFWGEYVLPTIARNDHAFSDQFYWRGNIWGPTNYMVYQGLNRYGFDREAFQFAEKSYALFMDDWKRYNNSNENYHAWGGNGGGDTHYTWGALLCLEALEQYIDVNPWDGLRFGMLNPPTGGEWRGALWHGHRYDVTIGPQRTAMTRDGTLRFEADRSVVVRRYEPRTFTIKADSPVNVTSGEFDSGELQLKIDSQPSGSSVVRQSRASFRIPAGEHLVELVR
jgi:hypothetical protein